MQDQSRRETDPLLLRQEGFQSSGDLLRILEVGQAKAAGEPPDVGVNSDAGGNPETHAEDHLGSLSADTG